VLEPGFLRQTRSPIVGDSVFWRSSILHAVAKWLDGQDMDHVRGGPITP